MAKKKKDGTKVKGNALEKFASRGTLQPDAVYYFDPPLEAQEIYQLENLLKNLKRSDMVTSPLSPDRQGEDQRLLWIETNHNGDLDSWQNPEDELQTKKDVINWYKSERSVDAFYNGRELLNTPNVEDIFDKLYESERKPIVEVGSKRAKDTNIVYRDSNMVILVPLSYKSAQSYSRGTQYCTGGDCGSGSDSAGKSMFKHHVQKGDILYRIIFKNGTKVRLTWDGDINSKDFHWGLGKKDSYPVFTNRNMSNPFDLEMISEIRDEQLRLGKELGPKIKEFKNWESKFYSEIGPDALWDLSNNDRLVYFDKKDEIFGDSNRDKYWWDEDSEKLYDAIHLIPKEAITKMVEYVGSKKHKVRIPESIEDEFEWAKESIKTLPPEFVIAFCRHSLNKHRKIKADSMFRFHELKNLLLSMLNQPEELSRLEDEWFKHAMEGSRGRIVMYFGTHDGILDWNGWDTCEENSIDSYEFVFPVEMFINIYSGKDQQVMNFDKLTEQEGDEFDWVKDLGLPKGLDRSLLNKMAGGHQLVKLRLEDLTPGLMVKRARGQFLYEIGERTTMDIEGNIYKGYKLLNVTTAHSYFAKDSQILKDFHIVTIDTVK